MQTFTIGALIKTSRLPIADWIQDQRCPSELCPWGQGSQQRRVRFGDAKSATSGSWSHHCTDAASGEVTWTPLGRPPPPGASQASSHLTFQHIITVDHFLLPRYLCSVTFCCLLSYLGGPSSLSPPLLPPHLPHIWVLGFLGLFLLAHSSGQSLLAMALLTLTLTPRLLSSTQTPADLTTVLVSRSPCQPNVPEQ